MNTQIKWLGVLFWMSLLLFPVQAQSDNEAESVLAVGVTDEYGRHLNGLKAESFEVLIDGKRQKITSFAEQDVPSTIVFMIDLSASQEKIVASLAKGIEQFTNNTNLNNEYIVIAFNEKVELVLDKTQNLKTLGESLNKILSFKARGNTAFYDSMYLGIGRAISGEYQKKTIIIFSDGRDTQSQFYNLQNVKESLKQSDVMFYAVDYEDGSRNFALMPWLADLEKFSEISGGKTFFPSKPDELSEVMKGIALELKSQYRIGFKISDAAKPGKWRGIKIKVEPLAVKDKNKDKKIKLTARTRSGICPIPAK